MHEKSSCKRRINDVIVTDIHKNNFLVLGRAGMDLYADPPGTETEHAHRFTSALGGSSANIAAGITRLGGAASLVTSVSDDAVGRFTRNELKKYGIDDLHVADVSGEARTSLAVVETRAENCQSVIYRNRAADFQVTEDQVRGIDLAPFGALILTGTCLAMQPSRCASMLAHPACQSCGPARHPRHGLPPLFLDKPRRSGCNLRSGGAAVRYHRRQRRGVCACSQAHGGDSLAKAAEYASRPDRIVVHKMGGRGSVTFCEGRSFETGIFKVAALKPTGAGDAFLASFCVSLAEGRAR